MTRSKSFTLNHHQNSESSIDKNNTTTNDKSIMDDKTNVVNVSITPDKYGTIEDEYYFVNKDVNGNHIQLDMNQKDKTNEFKSSKSKPLSDIIEYHGSFNTEKQEDLKCKGYRSRTPSIDEQPNIKISDIIGDFGKYQIVVVIFAALRAMCCAVDGLSGAFLAPSVEHFECISSDRISQNYPDFVSTSDSKFALNSSDQQAVKYVLHSSQCYFVEVNGGSDRIPCTKWSFDNQANNEYRNSLTIEYSLVCDRRWLKSFSNSMYFFGTILGLIFWGIISDKYGRKTAYVCSHFVTLLFGFSALFSNSMSTFILLRSINAFGMIGELIPRSIQVEIVEARYRSVCSVVCQFGWALGMILIPILWRINTNYKFLLAFPVVISITMLPWLIWLPESARWLMANGNYTRARNEIVRAAKINQKSIEGIDKEIKKLNDKVTQEEHSGANNARIGICKSIAAIFTNKRLSKDAFAVFVLLFMAEVIYFSLTINVADLGGSSRRLFLNSIISGITELPSILLCFFILSYLPRRFCLSLLLIASTISYLLMAVVSMYEDSLPTAVMLSVNAFGKLTAIGNLMIIILVSQEVFPTVIRQFGTSLCVTVGKIGSVVAPFTHELGQVIGHAYCFAMFSLLCLFCAIIPYSLLSETGKRELPDTVVDVEKSEEKRKKCNQVQNASSPKGNENNHDVGTSSLSRKSITDNIRSSFSSNRHQKLLEEEQQSQHNKTIARTSEIESYVNDSNSNGDDNSSSSGFQQYGSQHELTAPTNDSSKNDSGHDKQPLA